MSSTVLANPANAPGTPRRQTGRTWGKCKTLEVSCQSRSRETTGRHSSPGGASWARRIAILSWTRVSYALAEAGASRAGQDIGDGTDWRRAIYHHRRLVSDPNVSDKEARSGANCMVLHRACHDDPVEFYRLHGFWPDNLRRK
jgi:hypothetical protein